MQTFCEVKYEGRVVPSIYVLGQNVQVSLYSFS